MPYRIYTSRMAHRTLLGHKSTEMALGGLILTESNWMYFAFRSTDCDKAMAQVSGRAPASSLEPDK